MSVISLRPAQIEAVKKMHNGCILCGDVGSGKSRTALAYYYVRNGGDLDDEYHMMDDLSIKDLYIITTAHKRNLFEWDEEMVPFNLGTKAERQLYSNKVVIDSWNNIKKYRKVVGAFFIFDEQHVTGRGAWVKSFLDIARKNEWILLSATPGDTWSDYIPVFVANGFYKHRTDFLEQHAIWDRYSKYPKIKSYYNTGRLLKYRNELLVDIRVKKPAESHHEYINVNYDKSAYLRMTRERWNYWEDKPIENASEYCLALRRIVNTSDSRQIAMLELYEQHPRMVVFYNFDYELEILRTIFSNIGVTVAEYNGHKHEPVPDCESWIYLVQYNAGNDAWNCIETDTMVFYSLNYSYKIMKQSAGRIDRLNTPFKHLYYYYLSTQSGIDLAIQRALKAKKKFNENKYVGDVQWLKYREQNKLLAG